MRIEINLATPRKPLERWLPVLAPLLVVASLFLLAWISVVVAARAVEYREVSRTVLDYQGKIAVLRAREARLRSRLRQPSTVLLYNQINFLNSLIAQKKVSLSNLTGKVLQLLPERARLDELSLISTTDGPRVEFSVEGAGSESVYAFLSHLENSPDFDSVAVQNQASEPDGPDKGDVILTCSARYVGEHLP